MLSIIFLPLSRWRPSNDRAEGSRLQLALNVSTILNLQTKDHKWKVQTQCSFLLANLCLTRTLSPLRRFGQRGFVNIVRVAGAQDRALTAGAVPILVKALSAPITIDAAHVQSLNAFLAIAKASRTNSQLSVCVCPAH